MECNFTYQRRHFDVHLKWVRVVRILSERAGERANEWEQEGTWTIHSAHTYMYKDMHSKLLNFTPSRVSYHQIRANDSYSIFNFHRQFIYLLTYLPTHLPLAPLLLQSGQNSMVKSALKMAQRRTKRTSVAIVDFSFPRYYIWFS